MQQKLYYVGLDARRYRNTLFYRFVFLTALMIGLTITGMLYFMQQQKESYEAQIAALSAQMEQVNLDYQNNLSNTKIDYEAQLLEKDTQIQDLTERLNARILTGQEEFELARKYWYVFRDAPDNSGLTMNDMFYLDQLCKEDNLNPHIMWAIYDNESGYTAKIDNYSGSSARGLGQVLKSTGEAMYENVLQLGAYDHTMAYDPQINMQITESMIARNIDSGLWNAIALYSGDSTGWYYDKLMKTAAEHGVDITNTEYQ